MRPAQQADSEPVGILVEGRLHDGFHRLPQAGIDHVEARIAESPRHDLDSPIVAVETDLRQDDARPCEFVITTIRPIRTVPRRRPVRS